MRDSACFTVEREADVTIIRFADESDELSPEDVSGPLRAWVDFERPRRLVVDLDYRTTVGEVALFSGMFQQLLLQLWRCISGS